MLKGIDPLLTPELLKVLAEMGHGDAIAVVDANFTASTLAGGKPLVRLAGASLARACAAVLSVFPLGTADELPVAFMQVGDMPDGYLSPLQREVVALCEVDERTGGAHGEPVERFAFYQRVREAYAIVQTGEMQAYANFIFTKGVIADAAIR